MSALARWFKSHGKKIFGYDLTKTGITTNLETEGIEIHYQDNPDLIPEEIREGQDEILVVYTPAIPTDHKVLTYLRSKNKHILKRSEVTGLISESAYTIAIAGTHGKTTTSTILAHLLKNSGKNMIALLGGISSNYNTNFIHEKSDGGELLFVIEADEYDRSFLHLHPDQAVVTSMDPDHLDIYGDANKMAESFIAFIQTVPAGGHILINNKVSDDFPDLEKIQTYGLDQPGCHTRNVRIDDGAFLFDFIDENMNITDIKLLQPGFHNVENAVAAIKVSLGLGLQPEEIKEGISTYRGVKRRFEYIIRTSSLVFVDDYAHHPVEIDAFIDSLKVLYPNKKLTAVFQPHLYSRTRDFAEEFAASLSLIDEVFLMDIYPAREHPIPGVSSEMIFNKIKGTEKSMVSKEDVLVRLDRIKLEVLATIGAGDIDQLVEPIKQKLTA